MIDFVKSKFKFNGCLYKIFGGIYFYLQFLYLYIFQSIFSIFPIKSKKIVVVSYYGKEYGDSGKYICECLKKDNLDIYWAYNSKKAKNSIPGYLKKIKFNSLRYLFHLSTAKVLINNTRFLYGTKKRKKQVYVQLWHGGIAMKKVEFDSNLPKKYVKTMIWDNKIMDIMISNGKFCTKMYKDSFRFDGKILEFGTPRNDPIVNNSKEFYFSVRNELKLNRNVKVLMYAPTFRTNYDKKPYDLNFDRVLEILEKKSKEEWVIFIRMHPIVSHIDLATKYNKKDKIFNMTKYPDMQKLIACSDILVTDYSSSMFEAMMIDKKVLLYTKDIEEYKSERGFYFDIENLPFPIAKDSNQFYKMLGCSVSSSDYKEGYKNFIDKIGLIENGDASKKVSEEVIKITNGEYNE